MIAPRQVMRKACVVGFCFLFALSSLWAAGPSKGEKKSIPPDLLFTPKVVSAEDNAIVYWKRAGEVASVPGDRVKGAITYAWKPGATEAEENRPDIRHWIEENR